MKRKYFKAQALALVMIVLVVASIIGVSLFSRMSKEKQSSVDQQDSSIALSQVDAILDFFVGADIDLIENVLGEEDQITKSGISEITTLLAEDLELNADDINTDWCVGESSLDVTLEYAGNEDYFEVQPGSVLAYNLEGATATGTCDLELRLKAVEDYAVFVVKKIIDDGTVSEEIDNYCIRQGSSNTCAAEGDVPNVTDEDNLALPGTPVDDYFLMEHSLQEYINENIVELRIIPINGVLSVAVGISGEDNIADKQFKPIKITSEAVCNDAYRGKQMYLPASGNLGYSPLFDYAIYDSGLFQP
jgi:hypothetical protein